MSLTPEQIEARRFGIGGSDAAVVVGLSPYKTAFELYLEKRGEAPLDERETEAMEWGNYLEEPIARKYVQETGRKVRRQPMAAHGNLPFMIANIDRQILNDPRGPGVLEIKTTNAFKAVNGLEDLPDHYFLQMQHYLAVTGYQWGSFAFLIGGQRFEYFDIDRDQTTIDVLTEAETAFWQRVETGDAPPLEGTEAAHELLKRMYPTDDGRQIVIEDGGEIWDRLILARANKKAAEEEEIACQVWIKDRMGTHSVAVFPGKGSTPWKQNKDGYKTTVDYILMQEKFPDAYDACVTVESKPGARPFLVKPEKKG